MNRSMTSWQGTVTTRDARLSHILKTGACSDVALIVGSIPNQKKFRLHKVILSMYSDVFEKMFYGPLPEENEVYIPEIRPVIFEKVIEYVYRESFSVESVEDALCIYSTADKYNFAELLKLCIGFITDHLNPEDIPLLYTRPNILDNLQIKSKYEAMVSEKTLEILKSDNFVEFSSEMVKDLLQLDDLNIDNEEMLFEFVLKWAKERKSRGYTHEKLHKVMDPLLPHIRFLAMTVEGFLSGPGNSTVLTDSEVRIISINLACSSGPELPSWSNKRNSRSTTKLFSSLYNSFELFQEHICNFSRKLASRAECYITVTRGNMRFRGVSLFCSASNSLFPSAIIYVTDETKTSALGSRCFYDTSTGLFKIVLLKAYILQSGKTYGILVR